jgi:hypothetical protein
MTFNSALEDLQSTTLKSISGSLRRLEYLAGLRDSEGNYAHWGLARVHGTLAAARALESEHRSLLAGILSTPIERLLADLERSSRMAGVTPTQYLKRLTKDLDLLPPDPGAGSELHFSSVLHALSGLAETPPDAIHPAS